MVAHYKAILKCQTSEASSVMSGSTAALLISVGQDYHEGSKLAATIDSINNSEFGACSIMLADTLQRYNFYRQRTQEDAYNYSYQLGTEWLERNRSHLNMLTIPFRVSRWDEHLDNPHYADHRSNFLDIYQYDTTLRKNICETINNYICRRQTTCDECELAEFHTHAESYLLEECPVILSLWAQLGIDYIIYPQQMSAAFEYAHHTLAQQGRHHCPNWVYLRFKKKNANSTKLC